MAVGTEPGVSGHQQGKQEQKEKDSEAGRQPWQGSWVAA